MGSEIWMKRLLLTTIIIIILPVIGVMGFNYYIDPLWNYSHKNRFNDFQIGFDERQLKTNYINSRSKFDYDSLLIGTSRVTYMNYNEFENEKVFNYSLSSMHIDEYLPYIEYATKKNHKEFDTIYMELYVDSYDGNVKNTNKDSKVYIEKAEDPFYKITSLFSQSTLESSIENFNISKMNLYDGPRSYNRDNVAQTTLSNEAIPRLWMKFKDFFETKPSDSYVYDSEYKQKLMDIRNKYPNTKIVVFTDLMPAEKLKLILSNEAYRNAYERWYRDMVDVFGEVYSFHGYNRITENLDNFFDWFHYYPKIGDEMIHAIQEPSENKDILYIVNENNIEEFFDVVEKGD
ncbi:hypothetical protein [Robertmurraya kyonggiensis]|uniref:Uncharacterized protein n=1 Tax=Robertmurraya kyonggiensis TaxID=1037680 RepID=A0A4U1D5R4_9BACI|nr:hypothetical protein [Robertmurraya kyonggiensis]TKC17013.1 hypothetical protein FA727_13220 [Robertmurraya kyonggiensis]